MSLVASDLSNQENMSSSINASATGSPLKNKTVEITDITNQTDDNNTASSSSAPVVSGPSYLTHPQLVSGRAALTANQFDVASDTLGKALESLNSEYGEFSLKLAPIYFDYGFALYKNYVATSNPLGGAMEKRGSAENGEDGNQEEEEEEEQADEPAGPAVDENGEPIPSEDCDDLQAAFEVLEVARVIYQRHYQAMKKLQSDSLTASSSSSSSSSSLSSSSEIQDCETLGYSAHDLGLKLALTCELLGEVQDETENFDSSYNDYGESLKVRKAELPLWDRSIAGLHMNMATAAFFKKEQDPENGLYHYVCAQRVLMHKVFHLFHTLHDDMTKKSQLIAEFTQFQSQHQVPDPRSMTESQFVQSLATESQRQKCTALTRSIVEFFTGLPAEWKANDQNSDKTLDELGELKELIDELEERIVDVKNQIQEAAKEEKKRAEDEAKMKEAAMKAMAQAAASQPAAAAASGFSIPQFSFGAPAGNGAPSVSFGFGSSSATTSSDAAPVTVLAVKRKAPAATPAAAAASSSSSSAQADEPAQKKPNTN